MSDKEFINGLMVKPPHDRAPAFVKCSISIKVGELINWLNGKNDEWVNADVKVSKTGKWYVEVNNWKPGAQPTAQPQSEPQGVDPDFDDDPPF